jgi:hypothetical protein
VFLLITVSSLTTGKCQFESSDSSVDSSSSIICPRLAIYAFQSALGGSLNFPKDPAVRRTRWRAVGLDVVGQGGKDFVMIGIGGFGRDVGFPVPHFLAGDV